MESVPSERRRRALPAAAIDVAITLAAALAIGVTIAAAQESGSKEPDALAYVLGASIAAPLLWRRRRPMLVLMVSVGALWAYHSIGYPATGLAVPLAAAAYSSAAGGHLWTTALVLGGLELSAVGFRAVVEGEALISVIGLGTVADVALLAATVSLGEALRSRRAWMAEVEERMRRSEHEREREAQRRVEQERLRIARELHDVLAHTIAVINVQAGVAVDVMDDTPDDARAALHAIRDKGREAMAELKATVGIVGDPDASAPRAPAPGLAQLGELVEMANGAQLQVDLSVTGEQRRLPAGVDLIAYRIVQESLTNVLRHAGARVGRVGIAYEAGAVAIQVADDGRGTAHGSMPAGHGIAGMRERALALGGSFEAGPSHLAGGGFRVHAWLPTGEGGS